MAKAAYCSDADGNVKIKFHDDKVEQVQGDKSPSQAGETAGIFNGLHIHTSCACAHKGGTELTRARSRIAHRFDL
ncbi:hypothetical protein BC628DRAFT_1363215 [Trametes gibbosa]|nr:hypothetical protein BC628DRAFT_1363215 [Trametes gibbosa]